MIDLTYAQTLLQVIELGSFSAAAERLYLSKTTVKSQVDALENQVGAPLLKRSTKGVEPTRAGAYFANRIRTVIDTIGELEAECVRLSESEHANVIRVAFYSDFIFPSVQFLCDHHTKTRPSDKIEPVAIPFSKVYEAVRDHRVDVALCPRPQGDDALGISCTVLYTTQMAGLVSAEGELATRSALTRSDLAAHDVVIHSSWCPRSEIASWSSGAQPFRVTITDQGMTAMQAVCNKGGIYLYPETDTPLMTGFVQVPLEDPISSYASLVYAAAPAPGVMDFVATASSLLAPFIDVNGARLMVDWSDRSRLNI